MEWFLSAMTSLFCGGRSGEYSGHELALLTFTRNKKITCKRATKSL